MRTGKLVLLLGLVLGTVAFSGVYYFGTAPCRQMLKAPAPELAWLKQEFNLSDSEFARISRLHAAYLPQCAARCQRIEEQNQKLRQLLAQATNATPEIQAVLDQRARLRAQCETEMLNHFLEVSRTMPREQGRRYLAWVERQTLLQAQGMEQRHRQDQGNQTSGQHSM